MRRAVDTRFTSTGALFRSFHQSGLRCICRRRIETLRSRVAEEESRGAKSCATTMEERETEPIQVRSHRPALSLGGAARERTHVHRRDGHLDARGRPGLAVASFLPHANDALCMHAYSGLPESRHARAQDFITERTRIQRRRIRPWQKRMNGFRQRPVQTVTTVCPRVPLSPSKA